MIGVFRRLILSLFAIFFASSFSFVLLHIAPGDPVDLIAGDQANFIDREKIKKNLGLDKSLFQQYTQFMGQLILKGDLSVSLYSGEPVRDMLFRALPATFHLALLALVLAALWGVPAGFLSALRGGWLDNGLSVLSLMVMSLPVFFLAPILVWVFSIKLSLFPVSERGDSPIYWVLPALSLAGPLGAVLLKMSRVALLEVLKKDYIRTAQAKGRSFFQAGLRHGVKNALIPVVTVLGLQSSALLTGTVIVESIFDWPGIGLLLLESIQKRDYPVVQGAVLLIAVIYVLVNLSVDLIYRWINPKLRTAL